VGFDQLALNQAQDVVERSGRRAPVQDEVRPLAYRGDQSRDRGLERRCAREALSELVGGNVDVVPAATVKARIRDEVLAEAIPL